MVFVNQERDLVPLMSKLEELSDAEARREVCVPARGPYGSVRTT